jgi:hypothetical protein
VNFAGIVALLYAFQFFPMAQCLIGGGRIPLPPLLSTPSKNTCAPDDLSRIPCGRMGWIPEASVGTTAA